MAAPETLKTRASRLTGFPGLQRSTVGVLAMVMPVAMSGFALVNLIPTWQAVLIGTLGFWVFGRDMEIVPAQESVQCKKQRSKKH